jgi:hypothetical protein
MLALRISICFFTARIGIHQRSAKRNETFMTVYSGTSIPTSRSQCLRDAKENSAAYRFPVLELWGEVRNRSGGSTAGANN